MSNRLTTHFNLDSHLSMLSDKKLMSLLGKVKLTDGWGQNGVVDIQGKKVFVKRIPLTELEASNAYSTKNQHRIPTWYSYGIGSAGFGAFRELAAHVKTTNWVREGKHNGFPLLHHHRIVDAKKPTAKLPDLSDYVAYWNNSKGVERFMLDRAKSQKHLLVFIEHLAPLSEWMQKNPTKLLAMLPKALKTIDFLKENGIIHFDAHIYNWLTDGKSVFLTDFGLLLDREFELTHTEQQFFKQHRHYDYAQVVDTFAYALINNYLSKKATQKEWLKNELKNSRKANEPYMHALIRIALALQKEKKITLPVTTINYIQKHQSIVKTKNQFFHNMQNGKKSSDQYPAGTLAKLLKEVNII